MIEASRIFPGIYQGGRPPKGRELAIFRFNVLVLAAEEFQPPPEVFPGVSVVYAPLDDAILTPQEWSTAIEAGKRVAEAHRAGARVLVTCQQGRNRSGLVTALAIHMITGASGPSVIRLVKSKRQAPGGEALTNDTFLAALMRLPKRGYGR